MPEGKPIEDTDGNGHFKAGYKQTLTYMIDGTPIIQEITYIGYLTVTESIYYLNSWFNSKVLDRNVFFDPTIEGKLIQGYLEIHNAKQFQPRNIGDYGETQYFEEAAFWFPDVASSDIYAEPVHTLTSVKITKEWITNNGEIPDVDVEFELYADGVRVIDPEFDYLIKSGETELEIQRLPYYRIDETGRYPIVYTVEEIEMVGFDIEVERDKNLFKFTNIEYPLINFTVDKVWKGGSTPRPDIEIQLFQDGIAYLDSIVLKDGESSFTWTGLPAKDIDGNVHIYTADELTVIDDYMKALNDDGSVIVNTLIVDEVPDSGDRNDQPIRQENELPDTGFRNIRMVPVSLIALGGVILLSERRRRK